jgi:hypothetical protein
VETLKQGMMEVLNMESVMNEHLKKIIDNTVCSQLWMKDIAQLEKDNLETMLENFGTVKEVVVQYDDNMLNMIGSVLSEVSNKLSLYGDELMNGQLNMEKAIQEKRVRTNSELREINDKCIQVDVNLRNGIRMMTDGLG